MEEKDRMQFIQYQHLRRLLIELRIKVLGVNYHNDEEDVYTRDEIVCRDIECRFSELKTELKMWKMGFWFAIVCFSILSICQ